MNSSYQFERWIPVSKVVVVVVVVVMVLFPSTPLDCSQPFKVFNRDESPISTWIQMNLQGLLKKIKKMNVCVCFKVYLRIWIKWVCVCALCQGLFKKMKKMNMCVCVFFLYMCVCVWMLLQGPLKKKKMNMSGCVKVNIRRWRSTEEDEEMNTCVYCSCKYLEWSFASVRMGHTLWIKFQQSLNRIFDKRNQLNYHEKE